MYAQICSMPGDIVTERIQRKRSGFEHEDKIGVENLIAI